MLSLRLRSSTSTRLGFSLIFLLTAFASFLMLNDWISAKLESVSYGLAKISCPSGKCFGALSVYRICFASAVFHALLALSLIGATSSKGIRGAIQNGFWSFKVMSLLVMYIITFYIPNPFFVGFATYVDKPAAFLFILVQIFLLIDFAYSFSEGILELWEETEDRRFLILLLVVTGGTYVGSIVLTGLLYAWYSAAQCQLHQFFITFNWILCLIVSLLAISRPVQEANPKSGLAQASMITIYATYLIASAISSNPNPICNPGSVSIGTTGKESGTQVAILVLGTVFTFLAVAYSASSAAVQAHIVLPSSLGDTEYSAIDDSRESQDDEEDGVAYNYSFFHFIFILASCYLAMLVTNWDNVIVGSTGDASMGKSLASMWVKVVSSWVVIILYGWTLIARIVLPDRNWD